MAGPDFYTVLGVSRTATPDEIKSAHRELVKKYHPDLFPSVTQKARANKKLQQINEAYAILSNAERRRQYDARYFQKETVVKPAEAPRKPRSAATFRRPRRPPAPPAWEKLARRANEKWQQITKILRELAKAARNYYSDFSREARTAKQAAASQDASAVRSRAAAARLWNFVRRWTHWVSVKITAAILGIMLLVLTLRAVWEQPEIAIEWTLLQSTVVDPPRDDPGVRTSAMNWSPLGYHYSKAQCVESLRQRVTVDEQGGSQVFLDERTGSIAMTIYGKTEAALTQEFLREKLKSGNAAGIDRQLLEEQAKEEAQEVIRKNGFTQRVRHYQCRETQVLKPESWVRSKLRQIGLVS
jgi:DnaJ domain